MNKQKRLIISASLILLLTCVAVWLHLLRGGGTVDEPTASQADQITATIEAAAKEASVAPVEAPPPPSGYTSIGRPGQQ